jgi:uncharacterized protein (TIGR00375 family)
MFIADLHIHSKYSRATSKECVPEMLELWARRKGLQLIGTGDFTHSVWREELRDKLMPAEEGLYSLKQEFRVADDTAADTIFPRFIVSGEISSIYKKNGRVRKVHNLILLPSLEAAETLSRRLTAIGGNLHSDGRPILGLDSRDLLEITLETAPDAIFIPAHIWTPHFSLFGAYSGFDDIRECFEDLTDHIHALETGLSSDPSMNWRLLALDAYTLVSNSDAHSPGNLAREANIFNTSLSYPSIAQALADRNSGAFQGTIEFFPEEGKYHFDGHRNCKVCLKPSDTIALSGICPECGGRITVGVLHRVEALADRAEGFVPPNARQFERLVPLGEVVASSLGMTPASKKVKEEYGNLLRSLGPELYILREAPLEDIAHKAGALVAEGIRRLRLGAINIEPGYDGEYGKIHIFNEHELNFLSGQLSFLGVPDPVSKKPGKQGRGKTTVPQSTVAEGSIHVATAPTGIPDIPYSLNEKQWEAVSATGPAIAVVAGPGTGKTKTLVSRIAYLIERCGVSPAHITAVTFTNKAAKEMRDRLDKLFPGNREVRDITFGTFHSICLNYLSRQRFDHAITVIDEPNARFIAEDILCRFKWKASSKDFLREISLIKNGAHGTDMPPEIVEAYGTALAQFDALDFDDILLRALELFENEDRPEIPAFRHILVDEFQDVNPVQLHLIKAWSKNSEGVFVIGDPDQSIYGFRGSDPHCFDGFFADFAPVRRVHLTQNYRSTPEILLCAQGAFAAAEGTRALTAHKVGGSKVRLLETENAFSEALFVAKEINHLVGGIDMLDAHALPEGGSATRWGFSDIAVLYRTNRQAQALEQCLSKEGIPYIVAGRDDFHSDPQVINALSFFRFLLNPEDILSLRACLSPSVEPSVIAAILESYSVAEKNVASLAALLDNTGVSPAFDTSAALFQKYAALVHKEKPCKLLEDWMRDNALTGVEPMEMLVNTAVMYPDMSAFLRNLAIGQEGDVLRSGKRSYTADAVSLMTLHGAKGLEFPVVFLCGVTDGLIPYRHHNGQCNTDEERRLFYVGMTRAKDELILLTSSNRSPFLGNLPADQLAVGSALPPRPKPAFRQISLFNI